MSCVRIILSLNLFRQTQRKRGGATETRYAKQGYTIRLAEHYDMKVKGQAWIGGYMRVYARDIYNPKYKDGKLYGLI